MISAGAGELSLILLRPAAWQPLLGGPADLPGGRRGEAEGRLALSIVETLHARHIGMPPAFAWSLAAVLLRESLRPESYPRPWREAMTAVTAAAVDLLSRKAAGRTSSTPARLGASVPYTIYHVAGPLVERACRRVGTMYLFSEDVEADVIEPEAYAAWVDSLSDAIKTQEVYKADGENALFWQERALALMDLTLAPPSATPGKEDAAPRADPQELALLRRLEPDPDQGRSRPPQLELLRRPRDLQNRRLRDAGIRGVTITQRPEEVHRRLISELIYPDAIELDRLLNEGYWITDRPPRPEEMRDALVAAVYPGPAVLPGRPAQDAFVRATWFEFAGYISGMLQASGLAQTELRWIDGNVAGRWRSLSLLLRNLPDLSATSRSYTAYRDVFRLHSGWLPHLLDDRARHYDPSTAPLRPVDEALLTFAEWPARVWRGQRECAGWKPAVPERRSQLDIRYNPRATAYTAQPVDLNRFRLVHLMLLLPARLRPETETWAEANLFSQRKALSQLFDFDGQGRSLSITWVPDDPADEWPFEGYAQAGNREMPEAGNGRGTDRAAELMRLWAENLALEMANG